MTNIPRNAALKGRNAKRLKHWPSLKEKDQDLMNSERSATCSRIAPLAKAHKHFNEHECQSTPSEVPAILQTHLTDLGCQEWRQLCGRSHNPHKTFLASLPQASPISGWGAPPSAGHSCPQPRASGTHWKGEDQIISIWRHMYTHRATHLPTESALQGQESP